MNEGLHQKVSGFEKTMVGEWWCDSLGTYARRADWVAGKENVAKQVAMLHGDLATNIP